MNFMIKMIMITTCLFVFSLSAFAADNAYYQDSAGKNDLKVQQQHDFSNGMLTLKVMLTKLKGLVFSLNDINELESIGMSPDDVEAMRSTLLAKINQTKLHALALIQRL